MADAEDANCGRIPGAGIIIPLQKTLDHFDYPVLR